MSDENLNKINSVVDNYLEHQLHTEYDKQCSACHYERDYDNDNNPRDVDFSLMAERSEHPSNNYW
jgi:hypothetical protein